MSNTNDTTNDLDESVYLKYKLTHKDATPPTRHNNGDIGYDLNLVQHIKTVGKLEYYSTGVQVQPPDNILSTNRMFHCELFPRSSLPQHGYLLANSIGLLDNGYRGDVIACLFKFDEDKPDLELPQRLVQLVVRKSYIPPVMEMKELSKTDRGSSGFGSTNKKRKTMK